jgi:putative membrane protein
MRNILNIIRHDAGRLTSSVVAIITIMGLCIVPCLYAWFNIFSNWAPYESDATGRILVAVANEDEGADMLGFKINVGDKIVEALKANEDIGWRFVDSKEKAIEGVYAGDYYAALVVPDDFSLDVMSFVSGSLENPQLVYYENEKKNAIAPKITGKAKTAVQEQVNATFIETLATYVSDAASVLDANGYDPQAVFTDIGDKMETLSERLDDVQVMLSAAQGLADSADRLMDVSDQLLGSAALTVEGQAEVLDTAKKNLPKDTSSTKDSVSDAVRKERDYLDKNLGELTGDLTEASKDIDKYNAFVDKRLDKHIDRVEKMRLSAERTAVYLNNLGLTILSKDFEDTATRLNDVETRLKSLDHANETNWRETKKQSSELLEDLTDIKKDVDAIDENTVDDVDAKLNDAITKARKAATNAQKALSGMNGDLGSLSSVMAAYSSSLARLQSSLSSTGQSLGYMKSGVEAMAEVFNRVGGNQTLSEVNDLLADDESAVAEYLASPVKMKTEVIYPIETYGSAMAPFYTVLAQWVGALLTAVLIKTQVKKRDDLQKLKMCERFFGRYGLYMFIGLAQALIVSLGDLLYVGIQCKHPVLFVLQACMNGIVFMMINYALAFSLENIGLGAGVIILVLQVAGSGGTYPVEVLPKVFQVLYPVMPFRYSMNAMRECIAGTYDHTYAKCMGILVLFFVGAAFFGQLMQRPAKWINRLIAESKEKSEIML